MKIDELFQGWSLNVGASEDDLRDAITSIGRTLPVDYVQFLREHDGGEGFVGVDYLIIWRVKDLVRFNREYEVEKYAPGLLLFGSDGGGLAYGFDTRDPAMPVISVSFIGMGLDGVEIISRTFSDFLNKSI